MKWTYLGEKYKTIPISKHIYRNEKNDQDIDDSIIRDIIDNKSLVYHTRWDKVFYLKEVKLECRGHRLRARIECIYTQRRYMCSLQDLEIVKRRIKLKNLKI